MSEEIKDASIETSLALLNHRVEVMHEDFTEMRTVLKELTTAINKLTVVEERQTQFAEAQERAFKIIGKIEERVSALEKRVPENDRIKVWIDRAVVAVMGVVFLYAVKHLGLM